MKILYAIKDKYKGVEELVTWEGVPGTVATWDNEYDAKSELPYLGAEAKVVPLLVLPTEPCEVCKKGFILFVTPKKRSSEEPDWPSGRPAKLCPNCGRSLK